MLSFLTMSYIRGISVAAWMSLTVVREWPVVRSDARIKTWGSDLRATQKDTRVDKMGGISG